MKSRPILDGELREMIGKPGPSEYDVIKMPGTNSKINHGTLHDISLKARIEYRDNAGNLSPGPARYNHKAGFETKGLWEKIKAMKGPPDKYWRKHLPRDRRRELEEAEGPMSDTEAGEYGYDKRSSRTGQLSRVESSPL